MSPGALLVGLAATIVLVAYVARPFRKTADLDREIEAWVAALESVGTKPESQPFIASDAAPAELGPGQDTDSDVAFCHQCGRPVRSYHRFCPRCGAVLSEAAAGAEERS